MWKRRGFLEELRQASFTAAQHDLEDLQHCAAAGAAEAEDLCHGIWRFGLSACTSSATTLTTKLRTVIFRCRASSVVCSLWLSASLVCRFGQRMEKRQWHEDVRFFRVYDDQERPIAAFILTRTADRPRSAVVRGWMSASGAAGFSLLPDKRCVSPWPISSATRRRLLMANPHDEF